MRVVFILRSPRAFLAPQTLEFEVELLAAGDDAVPPPPSLFERLRAFIL